MLLGDFIMDSESNETATLLDGANQTTAGLIQEIPGHLEPSQPLNELLRPQQESESMQLSPGGRARQEQGCR